MIERKMIKNREYAGRHCIGFEIELKLDDESKFYRMFFTKLNSNEAYWRMLVVYERKPNFASSVVYSMEYPVPKSNASLEFVAAVGITMFKNELSKEIEEKSKIIFAMSDMVAGL